MIFLNAIIENTLNGAFPNFSAQMDLGKWSRDENLSGSLINGLHFLIISDLSIKRSDLMYNDHSSWLKVSMKA